MLKPERFAAYYNRASRRCFSLIAYRAGQAIKGATAGAEGGGIHLAGLARGGEGQAHLSNLEMRTFRDWELLRNRQAVDTGGESVTVL